MVRRCLTLFHRVASPYLTTYELFDVSGQRLAERKTWIHCVENVTVLVFHMSRSEYDQMMYEDECVPSRISVSYLPAAITVPHR
ncbi:hypothetical protein C8J57DRAFT_1714394 [Mycena rebaudengoi]|nr:hypothetical protein C8J57DRAFT_1714394 [Mycena rebaudengoi]